MFRVLGSCGGALLLRNRSIKIAILVLLELAWTLLAF